MTREERKLEAALEAYFHAGGWSLDVNSGDHFAIRSAASGPYPPAEVTINLTECAKALAAEIGRA